MDVTVMGTVKGMDDSFSSKCAVHPSVRTGAQPSPSEFVSTELHDLRPAFLEVIYFRHQRFQHLLWTQRPVSDKPFIDPASVSATSLVLLPAVVQGHKEDKHRHQHKKHKKDGKRHSKQEVKAKASPSPVSSDMCSRAFSSDKVKLLRTRVGVESLK